MAKELRRAEKRLERRLHSYSASTGRGTSKIKDTLHKPGSMSRKKS